MERNCDYSNSVRYADLIDELVTKEHAKKIEDMNADAEKDNKKMIKDLMNSHFKIVDVGDISHRHCMTQLQAALPHIPDKLWQTDVYGDFVRDIYVTR